MKQDEDESMQSLLKDIGQNCISKDEIPAMNKLKLHMISRIDDSTHFEAEYLETNSWFNFCLKAKLKQPNNVCE